MGEKICVITRGVWKCVKTPLVHFSWRKWGHVVSQWKTQNSKPWLEIEYWITSQYLFPWILSAFLYNFDEMANIFSIK